MNQTIVYKRPPLYNKQEASVFNDKRFHATEASTKSGKTHLAIIWIFEKCITSGEDKNHWWVAPVYRQSKIAFRRMKRALREYGEIVETNDTELFIHIRGAGTIWFLTGDTPDNLYGEDVVSCVMDEASRSKEEAFYACRSTLTATGGELFLIGNVTNKINWFYKLCRKIEDNDNPDWSYSKLTIYDAVEGGVIASKEIESAKRDYPEHIFNALYLAEPGDLGLNPIGIDKIHSCIRGLSDSPTVAFGIDLARKRDKTIITGIDIEGIVTELHELDGDWSTIIPIVVDKVAGKPSYIDATGLGDVVIGIMHESFQAHNILPYVFSFQTKNALLQNLIVRIQNKEAGFPQGKLVNELEILEYKVNKLGVTYGAPNGMHDDYVMSYALALWNLRSELSSWADIKEYEKFAI